MTTENERRDGRPLPLDAAIDARTCGHKAATLAALRQSGHQIPDGFVIPVGGSCSAEALRHALERLGPGPYAVRSSGVAEDLADASFAGQYQTVLGALTLDDVVSAAERVRESGTTAQAAAYRAQADCDEAPLAVLVQRLVSAQAAGVMFSQNPVTGDDEVVIEAVRGLGDRLLAGEVDGDRWVCRADHVQGIADSGTIDESVARRLAELARVVARERGAPQDMEWAIAGGELYLLQARPITGLPLAPQLDIPPGRWIRDTSHFAGPMTPVGATILLPVYESAFEHTFAEFGLPLQTIRQRAFGGEVYTQDAELGGKHDPAAPPPWWVLALAVRLVPAMRRRMKAAKAAVPKLEEYPRRWERSWRDECMSRIDEARSIDLGALTDAELMDELGRLIDEVLLPHTIIHFQLTIPHMVGVHELQICCKELLGWETPQTMELLTGLSAATTRATREMAAIAAEVDDDVLAQGLEGVRATAAAPRLDAWLRRWGLRTIDLDPGSPMIAERDELVGGLLRQARLPSGEAPRRALEEKRQAAIARARAALTPAELERFDAALAYAETVYPQRDDNVEYTEGLPCGLVRRVLLEIGARLTAAGTLHAPSDVSFLKRDELGPALEGSLRGETAAARVSRRRAERAWMLAHPGPLVYGPPPVPEPDVRGLPAAARRIMGAVLWAVGEELRPPESKESEDGALLGIGVSGGSYTGPVRVIPTEAALERVRPGDVMVCRTTDSGWTVVFGKVGALVTDGGGMLSHPAIIAREHNVPAVVATGRATSALRDGQIVTVDGIKGRVSIHRSASG